MANFPASLDTLTNPAAGDVLTSPPHHTQHTDANDILEALETKVGTGASTPTTTGHALMVTGAGATAYGAPVVPEGRLNNGGTIYYSIPGMAPISMTTLVVVATNIYYEPIIAPTPITLDRLVCEVTVAGAAASVNRLGIYVATTSWAPGALVVDGGTVAADSTGIKTITLSPTIALVPGRYLLALRSTDTPTMRVVRANGTGFIDSAFLGSSPLTTTLQKAGGSTPLADPGQAADTGGVDNVGFRHMVYVRVSTP